MSTEVAVLTRQKSLAETLKDPAVLAKLIEYERNMPWLPKDYAAKWTFESIDRQRRIKALFAENPSISFSQTIRILMAELLPESASDAETVEFFNDSHKWFEKFRPVESV